MTPIDHREVAKAVYDLANSSSPIAPQVKEALEVIDSALDFFKQEHLSLSFNGGKDCTVLLHLYAAALSRRLQLTSAFSIRAVYIPPPSPFHELDAFIHEAADAYSLGLFSCFSTTSLQDSQSSAESVAPLVNSPLDGNPMKRQGGGEVMKRALEMYKDKCPQVEAILIGTRRTDPHGEYLSFRNTTDPSWPKFERINPIINWSYTDVWAFLRALQVPYCSLYDHGYTSIGSTYNTFPNPALLIKPSSQELENGDNHSTSNQPLYRPAYELLDGSLERAGRGPPPSKGLTA